MGYLWVTGCKPLELGCLWAQQRPLGFVFGTSSSVCKAGSCRLGMCACPVTAEYYSLKLQTNCAQGGSSNSTSNTKNGPQCETYA
jgi:hypothetical protein